MSSVSKTVCKCSDHAQASQGPTWGDSVVPPGGFICPFCSKAFQVKKTWSEHNRIVLIILTKRVHIFAGL